MGAFRSKPIVDKVSKDEENDKLRCAVSTMQGWRLTQEDAYNFILDYDKDTSYFAVYDGHGGHEVAEYLATHLPQYLKDMETYKSGDVEKTFIDGFLQIDASLTTPEVMNILNEVAMGHDEEENIDTLYEEASMPVEKVLKKYIEGHIESIEKSTVESSTSGDINKGAGCSKERSTPERSRRSHDSNASQSHKVNDNESEVKSENSTGESDKLEEDKQSADSSKNSGNKTEDSSSVNKTLQNGDTLADEDKAKNCNNSENPNDETAKGKGKAIVKRITPVTIEKNCTKPIKSDEEIYKMFLKRYVESEEESEDSEEVYESSNEDTSDEQEESEDQNEENADESKDSDGTEPASEKDDEDGEDYEDDDDDEDENDDKPGRDFEFEKPGIKSGSTGVVALLKGNQLYVANVGDSRCVVCREGKAVPMSYDHKARNKLEYQRIEKAGGRVDCDDRVDGGLNMSRAFGDHFYKSNKELSQTEQLIIALPDVKTLTIDPNKDEFMLLASDGIWDVKRKGQEVIDFLRPRMATCEGRLSSVIEELFDECLSKYAYSSGSDNMTLILVQFKSSLSKRSTSPLQENPAKKLKSNISDDVAAQANPSVNC